MEKRTINKQVLRSWVANEGRSGRARLAAQSDCSPSLIEKLLSNYYEIVPRLVTQIAIAKATGHSRDVLFPKR